MARIRRAVAADAATLSGIALEAKRHWGYPDAWMETWRPSLTLDAAEMGRLEVFVFETAGEIAGFYAMSRATPRWRLDHLWVRPQCMGQGTGRQLVSHALASARAAGATGLDIETDPHAEPFYRHLGGERVGETPAPVSGAPERQLPVLVLDRIVT